MAYKNTYPTLAKVGENEPIFVLRAQDVTAPDIILAWIRANPSLPEAKRREAFECSELMRKWPKTKFPD